MKGITIEHDFSDGGPHDFKFSALLYVIQKFKQKNKKIKITWNFFESYHGWSIADARAVQAANKLYYWQQNNGKIITNKQQIANIIQTMPNHHQVQLLPNIQRPQYNLTDVNTKRGIRQIYQLVPDGIGTVRGWKRSIHPTNEKPAKGFQVNPKRIIVQSQLMNE